MDNRRDPIPRGRSLDRAERERLARYVAEIGEYAAVEAIGCSRRALHAALAAAPVYGVTRAAIRAALGRAADHESQPADMGKP